MSLRLYNTLTRSKQVFTPLDAQNVRMYVCGPTVYDYAHIGNARPVIVFDILFRLLRHIYGENHVTYVRNITDIDDKINARALAENISIRDLTEKTATIFQEDVAALGTLPPTHSPRATDFVEQMISMISSLIAQGHAYAAEGHVLFDVGSKADYGKLARRSLDDMIAGARVDVAPYKKGAMDFVLWKPSDATTPGWESPWGRGRPGWHIECSAMAGAYLGKTFDIHGGGIDLVFPHHENEIAQSECSHPGHPLAKVWMHNGFLNVEGEKMSKSLGNFVTIHELLAEWPGDVLRLNMLRTNYRQPIDWTKKSLVEAQRTLERWRNKLKRRPSYDGRDSDPDDAFVAELCEDLNTHGAITRIHKLINMGQWANPDDPSDEQAGSFSFDVEGEGFTDEETILKNKAKVVSCLKLIGIDILSNPESLIDDAFINELIRERAAARKSKNFAESDRIRDDLLAQGIVLKDGPAGTTWELKK